MRILDSRTDPQRDGDALDRCRHQASRGQFRRVKGYAQMPTLIAAVDGIIRTADTKTTIKTPKAA